MTTTSIIAGKIHCIPGYDLIPNSPESATLYDENSLLSTRPDSLENILFDANKKIGIIDDSDNYCVMNELDCFGNEENRNLQVGIDDMYQQMTDIDKLDKINMIEYDSSKMMKAYVDDTKLTDPRYPFELENLTAFVSNDANLHSTSRSYIKCSPTSSIGGMQMMSGSQYYTANTTNSNQLINISNKTINSTKQYTTIDANQFLTTKMSGSTTSLDTLNGGRRYSTLTTPIGYLQDDYIGNDFDMSFDLNAYDMDEAASSSSGSHLAFACNDPNILSDIPSRYLTAFNNIQNETM